MTATQEQFYATTHKLLPIGQVYPPAESEAILNELIDWIAEGLKDADDDAIAVFDGVWPDVAGDFVEDWERVLELPKPLAIVDNAEIGTFKAGDRLGYIGDISGLPSSLELRRDQVLAFFRISEFNNDAFYEDLADVFGLDITITTGSIPTVPAEIGTFQAGDPISVPGDLFDWTITVTSGDADNIPFFESLARFFKQAHTVLTVVDST